MITRAPGPNTRAVAEHTMAMILALAKDLHILSPALAAGGWREAAKVRDIEAMRLGIVGYGAIGRCVARFALAFGMSVTVWGGSAARTDYDGVARAENLAALLRGSDVLTLHYPLTPATRNLIDATALALLPSGALVINNARGGVIDEVALLDALNAGHVAGAVLDVFEAKPPPPSHPLRHHPRVIRTPHVSGVTDGALIHMGVMAAECIVAVLTGGTVPAERLVGLAD